MPFHDVRFPAAIAFHSMGGPERRTEIVTLGSGFEERNAVWANSRRRYDVGSGVRTLDDLALVTAFFEARLGRLYAFRFKDFADWKSCAPGAPVTPLDQTLGTGDGATVSFALVKHYVSGPGSWTRAIKLAVDGTLRVAVAGVELTSGFSLASGIVTFDTAPASGAAVTAGYEFDTLARFDTDALALNLATFQAGEAPSIPIVEVMM